jgi:CRP/FNR family transcriptional regulator, anaerobic regulatory protein
MIEMNIDPGESQMINKQEFGRIVRALPLLERADPGLLREFQETAFFARIPVGRDVFIEGDQVDAIALMISGVVRVYKIGETGREITLYRFGNGESCILTANAILSQKSFPAIATVEKEAEAVMIPAKAFREWVRRYDIWREFVFELLSQRLSAVMAIVEEVAFRRMDTRLAGLLGERSRNSDQIQITHQEIAAELGSSREVISRILEDFSAQGMIEVGRGNIIIMDREALKERMVV